MENAHWVWRNTAASVQMRQQCMTRELSLQYYAAWSTAGPGRQTAAAGDRPCLGTAARPCPRCRQWYLFDERVCLDKRMYRLQCLNGSPTTANVPSTYHDFTIDRSANDSSDTRIKCLWPCCCTSLKGLFEMQQQSLILSKKPVFIILFSGYFFILFFTLAIIVVNHRSYNLILVMVCNVNYGMHFFHQQSTWMALYSLIVLMCR